MAATGPPEAVQTGMGARGSASGFIRSPALPFAVLLGITPALAVALELVPDEGLAIAAPTARVPMPGFDWVGTGKVTGARPAAELLLEI
jgi:hypothetical protein